MFTEEKAVIGIMAAIIFANNLVSNGFSINSNTDWKEEIDRSVDISEEIMTKVEEDYIG